MLQYFDILQAGKQYTQPLYKTVNGVLSKQKCIDYIEKLP